MSPSRSASVERVRWSPLALALSLTVGAVVWAGPLGGQERLGLLGIEVDPTVYGLDGLDEVRRGRVAVAYAPEGPRMTLYYLRADAVPGRIALPEPPPLPDPSEAAVPPTETALWVWNTRELLDDAAARSDFLDFVEAQGITRVYLYLAAARDEAPAAGDIPFSSEEVGPLVASLRSRGALTYALDGDRDYVLPENHAGVYRTVRRLVEHNRTVPEPQRFHGVRYDIEPYLAPGFQGPARQALLDGYVELVAGVSAIAREGGLAPAVDVPFWFDAPDEETGAFLEAELGGVRAPVLRHVMRHVDDITIMDYRTRADGPNGALAHALAELELGAELDVEVFLGVETTRLLDEDLFNFFGPAREGLPASTEPRWIVLEGRVDGSSRLWMVDGAPALAELERRTRGASLLRHWPASRPARVAADAQSFYDLGADSMRAVTSEIVRRLAAAPAFAGLAYHDYLGLKRLLSGS